MSSQIKFLGHTVLHKLLCTSEVYRINPNFDVLLVYPTESGFELPGLKLAASRDRKEIGSLLAHDYAIVLVGPLPESYLCSPALMSRIKFLDRPYDPEDKSLENKEHVIWRCPYPGIDATQVPLAHGAAL